MTAALIGLEAEADSAAARMAPTLVGDRWPRAPRTTPCSRLAACCWLIRSRLWSERRMDATFELIVSRIWLVPLPSLRRKRSAATESSEREAASRSRSVWRALLMSSL